MSEQNPLLNESSLAYGAPDFGLIKTEHFKPALELGIQEQLKDIEAIAQNSEEATFENTFVALEKSGQLLNRVQGPFYLLAGAHTNTEIQNLEEEMAPKLANLSDTLFLNDQIFGRVKQIYEQRNTLSLDEESIRLVEYYYQKFVLAGAELSPEQKERMKTLNEEEALLCAQFENKLLIANQKGGLEVSDSADLAGLSEQDIEAYKKEDAGKTSYYIPLLNTTQQPDMASLSKRETRKKLYEKSITRTEKGDEYDTQKILIRIAEIRAEQAQLMGYKTFAEWQLQDQMAKTPEAARGLLAKLTTPAIPKAKQEAEDLQKTVAAQGDSLTLEGWDWNYYAEFLRKEKYGLEEKDIRPYFEANKVLEDGVFYAAKELYGISCKERFDIPVYHKDVRVFELFNEDDSAIGLFYVDLFKRDEKGGGAWMGNVIEQSHLLGHKPVIYNICNFPQPKGTDPSLLSFDNVETMFHEFGHALHGFFADQHYPSLSGTNVPRDFVELPSQINEHWALHPQVFANYAKHYKTGELMPQALVDKVKKSSKFNQGYALSEFLQAALLDQEWHSLSVGTTVKDVKEFENNALKEFVSELPQILPRYRSSYFLHIWGHGYSAGYYAYLWAEMLDTDAFQWFEENGGLSRENGQRFRELILSRGNSGDLNQFFRDFRGADPDITPLLRHRGLID
ncbi:M3 family metallopeptidase [Spirochaeta cellobiosiphila]|uniref:M3 family metallopeptidase n=1 Tax=Spirochaeta cellobiosiphila TaxID=504483 RepID=UPI00040AC791|nr:M3 family metallopeptidase [Spirochaeta cellobiosiphila]